MITHISKLTFFLLISMINLLNFLICSQDQNGPLQRGVWRGSIMEKGDRHADASCSGGRGHMHGRSMRNVPLPLLLSFQHHKIERKVRAGAATQSHVIGSYALYCHLTKPRASVHGAVHKHNASSFSFISHRLINFHATRANLFLQNDV
jgi:hypothetical protein